MKQFDPAMMALLSAGAGMMDPTGTYGSSGARFNKGVQQGMATYLPMAQFEARKKEAASRRKDVKEQNQLRNTLLERQIDLQEANAERMATQWESTHNLNQSKFKLAQDQYQHELDVFKGQQEMFSQFVNPPPPTDVVGPRVGNDPATSLPPGYGAQPQQWGPRDDASAAMLIQAGAEPSAVKMVADARRPITDPSVRGYNRSAHLSWLEGEKAVRKLTPREEAMRAALEKSAGDPLRKILAKQFEQDMAAQR